MPMRLGSDLPALDGATEWVNGEPAEIAGSPVLVHFWAVSCYLCKKNMTELRNWKEQYGARGLKLVAVHMPRQESDTDVGAVRAAITELEITESCAIDNRHLLKNAFQNDQGWVPAYYLFDANGTLKSRTAGDAGLGMLKGALEKLLGLDPAA